MIAEGFTCQRYGFNVGADKFSLLTIENGKTSIMRLSEWTLISQSQKSHSDRLLGEDDRRFMLLHSEGMQLILQHSPRCISLHAPHGLIIKFYPEE